MNKGKSVVVFRQDLSKASLNLRIEEIKLDNIDAEYYSDIPNADVVLFVEQANGDTKVLKNRYGHIGVVK